MTGQGIGLAHIVTERQASRQPDLAAVIIAGNVTPGARSTRWRSVFPHRSEQIVAKSDDLLLQSGEVLRGQRARIAEVHVQRALAKASPASCQLDSHLTLVGRVARALDITKTLQLLENRGQGVGLEEELLAEATHGLIALFRQGHDGDVLRVSQSKLIKDRPVDLAECQVCRIDSEAQEIGQLRR